MAEIGGIGVGESSQNRGRFWKWIALGVVFLMILVGIFVWGSRKPGPSSPGPSQPPPPVATAETRIDALERELHTVRAMVVASNNEPHELRRMVTSLDKDVRELVRKLDDLEGTVSQLSRAVSK